MAYRKFGFVYEALMDYKEEDVEKAIDHVKSSIDGFIPSHKLVQKVSRRLLDLKEQDNQKTPYVDRTASCAPFVDDLPTMEAYRAQIASEREERATSDAKATLDFKAKVQRVVQRAIANCAGREQLQAKFDRDSLKIADFGYHPDFNRYA